MLLGTLGALILGNILTEKKVMKAKKVAVAEAGYNAMDHMGENVLFPWNV